jgi:hypothetical protein
MIGGRTRLLQGRGNLVNGEYAMIPQNSNEGRSVERTTACVCVSVIRRLMGWFLNDSVREIEEIQVIRRLDTVQFFLLISLRTR